MASAADSDEHPPSRTRRARLGPPGDILESSRWLFLALTLASGLIVLPQAVLGHQLTTATLAVASSGVLAASVLRTYRRRYQDWPEELAEILALVAFASCTTQPTAVFGVVFGRLWFRALYGSAWTAVVRPAAYLLAVVLGIVIGSGPPGLAPTVTPLVIASFFPVLLLTGIIGRRLASGLHAGAENARLDAIQVRLGAEVLGVTDVEEVRRAAWRAHEAMCAVVPGLRLVVLSQQPGTLQVHRADGSFLRPPAQVPVPASGLRPGTMHLSSGRDPSVALLNEAAGEPCSWVWLELPDAERRGSRAWLVLGAPGEVPARALLALSGQIHQVSLAQRNCALHATLTEQATHDALTGLHNRSSFLAALTASLESVTTGPTSVLFVDLDEFKEVNDLFGHQAGDLLLAEVARRLREAAGPGATCGRIGGDEFAVLLTGADASQAAATARLIAQRVEETTYADGSPAHVGACIGVATADDHVAAEDLVHRADVAMYAAKAGGKGRISTFDLTLPQRDADQATFERELADAARAGQLVVHYQPVLSLPDGRCTAVEALVRWQHPLRGLVGPASFIPTAERTGAIRSIGSWVLRQSLRDIAELRRRFPDEALAVHVNVSARQLEDDELLTEVRAELDALALDPQALVVEVTESLAISSPEAAQRLDALAEQGVLIAIDDFGTGYSALQTLRALPIHIVKIDRSFVAGCADNPEDRAVTEAIVQMAGKLGIRTVAEGVELREQQDFLESIGTSGAQGYLYRRPGTAAELGAWLDDLLADRVDVPHQATGPVHDVAPAH